METRFTVDIYSDNEDKLSMIKKAINGLVYVDGLVVNTMDLDSLQKILSRASQIVPNTNLVAFIYPENLFYTRQIKIACSYNGSFEIQERSINVPINPKTFFINPINKFIATNGIQCVMIKADNDTVAHDYAHNLLNRENNPIRIISPQTEMYESMINLFEDN